MHLLRVVQLVTLTKFSLTWSQTELFNKQEVGEERQKRIFDEDIEMVNDTKETKIDFRRKKRGERK